MKIRAMLAIVALVIVFPVIAFGTDSVCTVEPPQQLGALYVLRIDWTAASTDGSFTQCPLGYAIDGILTFVETDPGTPAPTNAYDITFTDDLGLAMTVSDCSNATTAMVKPTVSGTAQAVPVSGGLKLDIANNSVNSAKGVIRLFYFGR